MPRIKPRRSVLGTITSIEKKRFSGPCGRLGRSRHTHTASTRIRVVAGVGGNGGRTKVRIRLAVVLSSRGGMVVILWFPSLLPSFYQQRRRRVVVGGLMVVPRGTTGSSLPILGGFGYDFIFSLCLVHFCPDDFLHSCDSVFSSTDFPLSLTVPSRAIVERRDPPAHRTGTSSICQYYLVSVTQ